jgi:hypothetical protein
VKYGHVELELRGANPRTWKDDVDEAISGHPDVVLIVGGGVVASICLAALAIGWLRRRKQ